jgi:type IV pilus assembly protein PilQ
MMERFKWTGLILLISALVFVNRASISVAAPAEPATAKPASIEVQETAGYLEDVAFEKAGKKERVTLILSKQSGVQVESQAPNSVLVTLQNLFIPEDLRKPLGEGALSNVLRAVATQKSTAGSPVAVVRIDLKAQVPFSVKQVGNDVVLDFNLGAAGIKAPEVTAEEKKPAAAMAKAPEVAAEEQKPAVAMAKAPEVAAEEKKPAVAMTKAPEVAAEEKKPAAEAVPSGREILPPGSQPDQSLSIKQNGEQKLTINLQDATIKETLELLATRRPDLSIISTDDVDQKGKVTIHIKNITWDKALDTILRLKGLAKQQDGNVIMISTVVKMREEEADRKKTEEELKKHRQEELVEKGKLRQISIEAKIVEATEDFTRSLGVQWAYGSQNTLSSHYSMGVLGGTNVTGLLSTTTTPASLTTLPTGIAMTAGGQAVNFPATNGINPTLGVVLGNANLIFAAQLSAMETTSEAKIISSPQVVTMDGETANITQGSQIPVVTPASANSPATTTYKDALLSLKVKPTITSENKISMEIAAHNDIPDTADKDPATGNMPIFTNTIESKVVVSDGDTVIIGGIHKSTDNRGVTGVPWLYKIPVLGWLFKTESLDRTKDEIYIIVTPRILKTNEAGKGVSGT